MFSLALWRQLYLRSHASSTKPLSFAQTLKDSKSHSQRQIMLSYSSSSWCCAGFIHITWRTHWYNGELLYFVLWVIMSSTVYVEMIPTDCWANLKAQSRHTLIVSQYFPDQKHFVLIALLQSRIQIDTNYVQIKKIFFPHLFCHTFFYLFGLWV